MLIKLITGSAGGVIGFLTLINLLIFIDRGVIPGATDQFTNFINDNINTDHPSLFIGLLQSSFIIGLCISSPIFASLAHSYGTFHLVAVGIAVWIFSALMSGMAKYVNSYEMLLIGRVFSGAGEAAFICCIPPWVILNARKESKSTWLAIFYTAIPVGTALGYVYSSIIAEALGWQWAFFIEVIIMAVLLVGLLSLASAFPKVKHGQAHFEHEDSSNHEPLIAEKQDDKALLDQRTLSSMSDFESPNVWEEILFVLKSPIFVFITFGYGALTGVLIGLGTFGSSLFMGMDYFQSQVAASTAFGIIVSFAGILGFPIGGMTIDALSMKKNHFDELSASCLMTTVSCLFGLIFFVLTYFIRTKYAFLALVFIACTCCFVCNSAANNGLVFSVPVQNRNFAIALNNILTHMLGDVPSPIIAGVIKDVLAPGCVGDDDEVSTSEDCRDDSDGLRFTMLLISLWLFWGVFFFGLTFIYARQKHLSKNNQIN